MTVKKILLSLVVGGLVLLGAGAKVNAVGLLPIGTQCYDNDNAACASGDCEKSNIDAGFGNNKWFCDCDDDEDCNIYGAPASGDWDCEDGYDTGFDLDYCVDEKENKTANDAKYPIELNQEFSKDDLLAALVNREIIQQKIVSSITDDINDKLAFRIPGLNFSKLSATIDSEGYMYIPWLGELIKALYNYGLGVVSIVAVLMIIFQGAKIIASGGGEGKVEGLKKIGHVAIGLVIAWSSYVILYTINPGLTEFKPLKLLYIKPEPLDMDSSAAGNERPTGNQGKCGGGFGKSQNLESGLGLSGDLFQYAKYSYKYGSTCDRVVNKINAIILHYTASGPSATASGVIKSWSDYNEAGNPGAICQILVDKAGQAYQITEKLNEHVICHGGSSGFDYNHGGIGIEIMAANADELSGNAKQLEAVGILVKKISDKYGIPLTNTVDNLINGVGGVFSHQQITRCEGAPKQKIDAGEKNAQKILESAGGAYTDWTKDERCNHS